MAIIITDGENIIEEYQSLLNPQKPISGFISNLTGITNKMVKSAPLFNDIAETVYNQLKDAVFVAHNVSFDYRFLKAAFDDCGFQFSAPHLCTLQLSRKIHPNQPSHSLGKLCKSLGIVVKNRHRAYGDAEATARLFNRMFQTQTDFILESIELDIIRSLNLPVSISPYQIEQVREQIGVYILYDDSNRILYISKTKNLRKSIIAHFQESKDTEIQKIRTLITSFEIFESPTELLSIIMETKLKRDFIPQYGAKRRSNILKYGLFCETDNAGYTLFSIEEATNGHTHTPLKFSSKTKAVKYINKLYFKLQLSPKQKHTLPAREYNQTVENLIKSSIYPIQDGYIVEKSKKDDRRVIYFIRDFELISYNIIDDKGQINIQEYYTCSTKVSETDEIRKNLLILVHRDKKNVSVVPFEKQTLIWSGHKQEL
ncbi:MAG: exonuclease domain-containing protein [Chitinophagales bacterium]|nr:exonuclease domain-containing protein [Chitinophagales bacterium]